MARFQFLSDEGGLTAEYRQLVQSHDPFGELIGVYRDPGSADPEAIIVTSNGLITVGAGGSAWIEFAAIESSRMLHEDGAGHDILLVLRSGKHVHLRVAGEDGRFRDVFGFVHFIDRVVEDLNSR
jgi:hypothetical protein